MGKDFERLSWSEGEWFRYLTHLRWEDSGMGELRDPIPSKLGDPQNQDKDWKFSGEAYWCFCEGYPHNLWENFYCPWILTFVKTIPFDQTRRFYRNSQRNWVFWRNQNGWSGWVWFILESSQNISWGFWMQRSIQKWGVEYWGRLADGESKLFRNVKFLKWSWGKFEIGTQWVLVDCCRQD